MKFIPVLQMVSHGISFALMYAIINISGTGLISLFEAFKQDSFGLDTLYTFRKKLEQFRKETIIPEHGHLYIDSGGYSFIQGLIHPDDLRKLITVYLHFMIDELDNYYRIFSLDLPFSSKYNLYNTKENVFLFNRISILETFNIIKQIPELSDKFIFIWQFRLVESYRIWCEIYDEICSLGYDKLIKHRAIGGLVGLKGETQIIFSPFMALAYRCFKDYITSGIFHIPFQLHLLGVYTLSDRFMIAYLEIVFDRYLQQLSINSGVSFSYDSTNYFRTAQFNARSKLAIHSYQNGQLHYYSTASDVPDYILRKVYNTAELYSHISGEINRIKHGERMSDNNSFAPLKAFTFIQEDRFIEDRINQYKLVDILFQTNDIASFRDDTERPLDQILTSEPQFFGECFKESIMDNMIKLYRLHNWWSVEGADYKRLNSIIEEFIAMIGATGKLM